MIRRYLLVAVECLVWRINCCVDLHTHAPLWLNATQMVEKHPKFALQPHSQLNLFTRTCTETKGHWGNHNKDMLMCANDVVISQRVQMEWEINTDATGNEEWVHWLSYVCVCVCVSVMCWRRLLQYIYCSSCREEGWSMNLHFTPALAKPTSPRTLTSTACGASLRKTDWPWREGEYVWGCLGPAFQINLIAYLYFPLESEVAPFEFQLTKKHVWVRSCAAPVTSPRTFI